VAACVETAGATWFHQGPLVPALLASSAVPVLFEPVKIGERHFLDGGLVDSIPLARAVELGSRTIFVLQVGRIEQPLVAPRNLAEVALVSFEIARRHRFATVMEHLPAGVNVHVLPTGSPSPGPVGRLPSRPGPDRRDLEGRIARAEAASRRYLAEVALTPDGR
jgi:NTE family protein